MAKLRLYKPKNWDPDLATHVANGCGPAGAKWKSWIVPDTIYGVRITQACKIHDFMYYTGRTMADKEKADSIFLDNMIKTFEAQPWWSKSLNPLRRVRAYEYYLAVRHGGKSAFLEGKDGVNDVPLDDMEKDDHRDFKKFIKNIAKLKMKKAA